MEESTKEREKERAGRLIRKEIEEVDEVVRATEDETEERTHGQVRQRQTPPQTDVGEIMKEKREMKMRDK